MYFCALYKNKVYRSKHSKVRAGTEQADRQTDRHTDRRDQLHYHAALASDNTDKSYRYNFNIDDYSSGCIRQGGPVDFNNFKATTL